MPVLWSRGLPDAHTNSTYYGQEVAENAGAGTLEEAHHELFKISPEVSVVHLAYTLLSVFTVLFGMFSAFIKEKLYAGEAIIATCVGIGFGPYGANIFSPTTWGGGGHTDGITLEVTRVVIALSVFAVGVELPKAYVWKHWRSLVFLLGPVMLVGWLVSAAFIYLLIPRMEYLDALVIAACVTPTDPILAASVVGKGKFAQEHVPSHIRHILQCESGCNDGAAFPFLYFALFWVLREDQSVGHAVGWWVVLVILYQILLGVIIGAAVGIAARKGMKYAKYHDLIDRESMVAMYVALALLVTGATTLAGSDDLLAAFACGTAFAWDDWFSESIEDSNFSSIIDLIVNSAVFFYIGATIPFGAWGDSNTTMSPWRLVVLGIAILFLRRIPFIFAFQKFLPDCRTKREALFIGHFGPMGVGALFIATLARERLPTPNYPPETHLDELSIVLEPVVYFIILCSVLVHGLSIPIFTSSRRLQRRVSSFQRTYTNGSLGPEPSWLSKVRRVGETVAEQADSEKKTDGEKQEDTPTSGSSTAAEGEGDDVVGHHDKGIAMEDGHPERVTRWQEGGKTVVEDAQGEVVEVDDPRGAAAPPKEIDLEAQKPAPNKKTQERLNQAEEAEEEEQQQPKHHWWKRDPKSGEPRELTPDERRQAKRDRAVRRERHYCTGNEPVRWREGNRIIIERNDGEVTIQEAGSDDEHGHPNVAGHFPGVHRITGTEHDALKELKKEQGKLNKAFGKIERGMGMGHRQHPSSDPEAGPSTPGLQRPKPAARASTGFKGLFGRQPASKPKPEIRRVDTPGEVPTSSGEPSASAEATQPQLDAPQEQPEAEQAETSAAGASTAAQEEPHDPHAPVASGSGVNQEGSELRSRHGSKESSTGQGSGPNLRFNLPNDSEVKRYDLED